ncbi:MAG: TatD family hydrolase [Candidatus Pacebacteria bacterium]|nr:TatD family hydrolase [Candidatus Paceibacterota bacterium]
MQPKFIDIHCHLDFEQFDKDREEVIGRMVEENMLAINIGADLESSLRSVELSQNYDFIFASAGIHPHEAEKDIDWDNFLKLVKSDKIVAIGECGLDYYRGLGDKKLQEELFRKQIEIAIKLKKPLVIHCREARLDLPRLAEASRAHNEVLKILSDYPGVRANIHFFSGNWRQAKKYLELGFFLSFAGPITFSRDYDEVIKNMPLERIMAETDSPFAAPSPWRGRRNEPVFVKEIIKRIAEIKEIGFEETEQKMLKNAVDFFGLKI